MVVVENVEKKLIEIFNKYQIQTVGNGYIDCICPKNNIERFISAIDELHVKIDGFTWWCFSANGHQACGMGGPKNKFGEGFYSEVDSGLIELKNNRGYKHYLLNEFPYSSEYKECLVPGFWLSIPPPPPK
jgi:hypothetical protein